MRETRKEAGHTFGEWAPLRDIYGMMMDELAETWNAIDALIDDLLATGCEVVAVGRGYCITPPDGMEATVKALLDRFGPRAHLMPAINQRLRLRGLVVEI